MADMSSAPTLSESRLGLRAFLRSRCGSLRSAFAALDGHGVGRVTSDGFVKGLGRLGYVGDSLSIFRELDAAQTGLISFRMFMEGIGGLSVADEDERPTSSRLLNSSRSMDGDQLSLSRSSEASRTAWGSAEIPRSGADVLASAAKPPRHRMLSRGKQGPLHSALEVQREGGEAPATSPSASSVHRDNNMLQVVMERLTQIEEQAASAEASRGEADARFRQSLEERLGLSFAEQMDVLRQQLLEESASRGADVAAVQLGLDACLDSRRADAEEAASSLSSLVQSEVAAAAVQLRDELAGEPPAQQLGQGCGDALADLTARFEEHATQVNGRLAAAESLARRMEAVESMSATQVAGAGAKPDQLGSSGTAPQLAELERQLAALREQLASLEAKQGENESACTAAEAEGLCQRQVNALREEMDLASVCRTDQAEELVRGRLDALRDELAVTHAEIRAGLPEAALEDSRLAAPPIDEKTEARIKTMETTLARFETDIGYLTSTGSRALNSIRKDLSDLPTDVEDIQRRVAALEIEGSQPSSQRSQEREGGRPSLSRKRPDEATRLVAEKNFGDRLAGLDQGLARLGGELRTQAAALERLQQEQQVRGRDVERCLESLIAKMDSKCEEGFSIVLQEAGAPNADSARAKDCPRLLGGSQHSSRAPLKVAPLRLPDQAMGRSQSCGDMASETCGSMSLTDADMLHALREENLRLRETNLEIREMAVAKDHEEDALTRNSSCVDAGLRLHRTSSGFEAGPQRFMVASPHCASVSQHSATLTASCQVLPMANASPMRAVGVTRVQAAGASPMARLPAQPMTPAGAQPPARASTPGTQPRQLQQQVPVAIRRASVAVPAPSVVLPAWAMPVRIAP